MHQALWLMVASMSAPSISTKRAKINSLKDIVRLYINDLVIYEPIKTTRFAFLPWQRRVQQ